MCIYLEASIEVLIIIQCEGVQGWGWSPPNFKILPTLHNKFTLEVDYNIKKIITLKLYKEACMGFQ